jgi:NAD(P)-dependent dehydrogenase (short-subunit alcohol dehydrogenase family)
MADDFRISFDGQVAIVTGSGRGLGRAHARELARRGAAVVVNDIGGEGEQAPDADRVVAEIEAESGRAVASGDSVATVQGGQAIVQTALERFGRLDVVIHNAGSFDFGNFEDLTPEQIDNVLAVHLLGAFWVCQPAFKRMMEQGYGRIVLTSSSSGAFGMGGLANYAAAKMALIGLAKSIASEGAEFGILANCILPYANAPRGPAAHASRGAAVFADHDLLRQRMEPESVSPLVVYLASRACAVTGESFSALAGRFARVFVGLTEGWMADDPYAVNVEQVDERFDEMFASEGFWIPGALREEQQSVAAIVGPS